MAAQRDPNGARRRILDAAAAEFAEFGFAGGRVDRIAAAAALNKRMLYHYFGAKAGLVKAVLTGALERLEAGRTLDAPMARLLLWTLLDPEAPAHASAKLHALERRSGRSLLAGLIPALTGDQVGEAKPRVRLKPRSASL